MSDETEALNGEEETRIDVTFFGVKIGTASGWDQYSDNGVMYYDFEPEEKFKSFFYGDVEPDTLCLDPFGEGYTMLTGNLDETEVPYDFKEFLKLLIAE